MRNVEDLLRRDRERASLPEPPDARYTTSVVRRRLGLVQIERQSAPEDWFFVLFGVGMAAAVALIVHAAGLSLWWLGLIPLASLALIPILRRNEG